MTDRYLDLGIIAAYLITITAFGAHFRHRQKSLKDYFLASRAAPWWAISFSIVAAETSTLTIIGVPSWAFESDMGFLQIILGYLLARLVIASVLLPHYFRGELYTAYELIQRRFGQRLRRLTAAVFLVTRFLGEGVRIYAVALTISVVLGTEVITSVIIITLFTMIYTFQGGMKAVIWTDVVQMIFYLAGGFVGLILVLDHVPGGWQQVSHIGQQDGKFQIFDFSLGATAEFFSRPYTFWAGFLGGFFLNAASHGTDQLIVQRLLSARSERDGKLAIISSWVLVMLQFILFLILGVALYVFHATTGSPAPSPLDRLYPQFIWTHFPPGIAGLAIAAILAAAMTTLAAALSSLTSTTVVDFLLPLGGWQNVSDQDRVRLSRWVTLLWAAALVGIALFAGSWGPVLEAGLSIASISLGALLGVFVLGVITRRANEPGAIGGMLIGLGVLVFVRFGTSVAWTWYAAVGCVVTFASGYTLSWLSSKSRLGDGHWGQGSSESLPTERNAPLPRRKEQL